MKTDGLLATVLTATSVLYFGACGPPPEAAGNHNDVLAGLGLDLDLGAPTGVDGQPLKDDYNPLGTKQRTLLRVAEYYFAGVTMKDGINWQALVESGKTAETVFSGAEAWAKLPKVSTAGDFDGDGREEIAIAIIDNDSASPRYKQLYLRIIEDKAQAYAAREYPIATLADLAPLAANGGKGFYQHLDLAAGDLDGDGNLELAVSCMSELWVLDDRAAEHRVTFNKRFPRWGGLDQFVRVAVGDTDGDNDAELVVVVNDPVIARMSIYSHDGKELAETLREEPVQGRIDGVSYLLAGVDATVADVDGDRLGEIVLMGRQVGKLGKGQVLIREDARASYRYLSARFELEVNPGWISRVETGDFDGDQRLEIVAGGRILDDLSAHHGELVERAVLPFFGPRWGTVLAVGDVTDDMRDDIVYMAAVSTDRIVTYGADENGTFKHGGHRR